MTDGVLFTFRVMRAAVEGPLPPHLRHFVMTLAYLANSETGRAHYGQAAIAKAMGCSDRQVRNYFAELEAHPGSPVRVQRRRRGSPDGKGRTSDEWQLVLFDEPINRNPDAASGPATEPGSSGREFPVQTPSSGTLLPVSETPDDGAQPEVCDSSTGSLEQLNRKPASRDLRSDLRSDLRRDLRRSKNAREESTKAKPKPTKATARPTDWKPNDAHQAYARKHGIDLELEAEAFASHHDSRGNRFVDWNAAFRTWLMNNVRWSKQRPAGGGRNGAVVLQRGGVIREGKADWAEGV